MSSRSMAPAASAKARGPSHAGRLGYGFGVGVSALAGSWVAVARLELVESRSDGVAPGGIGFSPR